MNSKAGSVEKKFFSPESNPPTKLIPVLGDSAPEGKSFIYGNPFIEKNDGVLYFTKTSPPAENINGEDSEMLCMVNVPAFFTCRELINFVSPMSTNISRMKIVRDDTPNQYMVIIKFKSPKLAKDFYLEYNNIEFNSIEVDRCILCFVERLEMTSEENALPSNALLELPTCSVCLEKMDDGVFTILCNHSFHAECLQKWTDTTCPVCRHSQTPELVPNQTCSECNNTTDLWMCLICGNVGCGRNTGAHAYTHYEATSHIFTLQVGGKLVWDYASDNYVQRLIQDIVDGKMVEHQGEQREKDNEKLDAIQMEFSCLFVNQLENQRLYFEGEMRKNEERHIQVEKSSRNKLLALEVELEKKDSQLNKLKEELQQANTSKHSLEKKLHQVQARSTKLQNELDEERQVSKMALTDKNTLINQRDALEKLRLKEISALEEQVHDLMMHFDAQCKLQDVVRKTENLSQKELEDGQLGLGETSTPTTGNSKKSGRRGAKK